MKKIFLLSALLGTFLNAQVDRPKLVVGVVVDQMRTDYLYRYNKDFSENGFKKLMNNGFVFKNVHYNYQPTHTAPGHASIFTGTTPAIHGIVGNSWFNKSEDQKVYVTTDPRMKSVGMDPNAKEGQMSPFRLKATTITDELKLETNFKGKVIGISAKDRGAILPAGHFADAAYWLNNQGEFISSSFYFDKLPKWVSDYNKEKNVEKFIKQGWNLLKPLSTYNESTEDNTPYEGVFNTKETPTFPYDLKAITDFEGNYSFIKSTPFGNDIVGQFAERAIVNEKLGKDDITDFLTVSFSSTDYVGHNFGPRAMETQDTYLRLDLTLAHLIDVLDKEVGKGNYLLFLTADHAAAENPKYLNDHKYEVRSFPYNTVGNIVEKFLDEKYGKNVFRYYYNQNIFLNEKYIQENNLDYNQILADIKQFLYKTDFINRVYTRDEILAGSASNYHLNMVARGYDPKQNGDIVVTYYPQFMEYFETGTSHGTTYAYDTHVPNIWYGWHVKKGETANRHYITDVVPTISQMLNIPIPNGSEGYILNEIFEK